MKRFLAVVLLGFAGTACADASVERAAWATIMETQLPALLCVQPPFSVCFVEGRPGCEKEARRLTRQCIADQGVPARFPASHGEKWGSKVGECVGVALERALTRKRPPPSGC